MILSFNINLVSIKQREPAGSDIYLDCKIIREIEFPRVPHFIKQSKNCLVTEKQISYSRRTPSIFKTPGTHLAAMTLNLIKVGWVPLSGTLIIHTLCRCLSSPLLLHLHCASAI